jgi:hypothetical protein
VRFRVFKLILSFIAVIITGVTAPEIHGIDLYSIREAGPPRVTTEGILFTYKPEKEMPEKVMVGGDFDNWRILHRMEKSDFGVFTFLYNKRDERGIVLKEGVYRYRYLIDGIWINDPQSDELLYDSKGTALSFFVLHKPIIIVEYNPLHLGRNDYLFYYKNDNANNVSIVGDFNNWNPYSHPMRKNLAGLWEIVIDIPPGVYFYRFVVDGNYKNDPLGRVMVYDIFDNTFTRLEVPLKEPPAPSPARRLVKRLQ